MDVQASYYRLIELDNKRRSVELTPGEAAELVQLVGLVNAVDPATGPVGTVDADAIIAAAGNVDTGELTLVMGPSVDNSVYANQIKEALAQEQEARMRAITISASILLAIAKSAI